VSECSEFEAKPDPAPDEYAGVAYKKRALEELQRHMGKPAPAPADLMQDDIKELLDAMGMFSGAQPMSPHRVIQEQIIPKIRSMCGELPQMYINTQHLADRMGEMIGLKPAPAPKCGPGHDVEGFYNDPEPDTFESLLGELVISALRIPMETPGYPRIFNICNRARKLLGVSP
jgi:hypothetical protein